MRKTCFLIGLMLSVGSSFAQDSTFAEKALAYQQNLNEEFSDPKTSPLPEEKIEEFDSLPFFEIDKDLIFHVKLLQTPHLRPFQMKTTTDRKSIYVKYGELHFSIGGKAYELNVYQSQRLRADPAYADYLFVPFTDLTNGKSTYPGGRYLDLRIPESDSVLLDFNRAYNPYCAYNKKYSCPVPPEENHLDISIKAGVKTVTTDYAD